MTDDFAGFDLTNFWEDSEYASKSYTELPPTEELLASVEAELEFRLPASYIALMKTRNGGIPRNRCYPTQTPTSWADDHVAITGIAGIGRNKTYSLCGELGSKFMQAEWGYPDFGICICDCPSAGHDMIMLDYRKCGKKCEPAVIHVDQERDHEVTFLAKDFETFIRGLVNASVFDTSADDLKAALGTIENGSFSTRLATLLRVTDEADFGTLLRSVCRRLTLEKGYFALHADERSLLVYDILFYLYARSHPLANEKDYLDAYAALIVFGDGQFSTGGYAPEFVKDWMTRRLSNREIIESPEGALAFSAGFCRGLMHRLQEYGPQ